ncbi:hypothetical protein EDD21DRAFT_186662 [Dissophora ornata]|nr:hypothetical protein EDD21DRAFT_186662 [Dissophora ornata]
MARLSSAIVLPFLLAYTFAAAAPAWRGSDTPINSRHTPFGCRSPSAGRPSTLASFYFHPSLSPAPPFPSPPSLLLSSALFLLSYALPLIPPFHPLPRVTVSKSPSLPSSVRQSLFTAHSFTVCEWIPPSCQLARTAFRGPRQSMT